MKAILRFDLEDEGDVIHHRMALAGPRAFSALREFDSWLRGEAKYQNRNDIPVDELRGKLRDLLEERAIDLDLMEDPTP